MIKIITTLCLLTACVSGSLKHQEENQSSTNKTTMTDTTRTIYGFQVASLDGGVIHFSDYAGKKILIVNTASQCGYTPQYKDLETLYQQYKDKLVIVGFPANNFGQQEPGNNSEIRSFCTKNYGVSFPMAAKVSVKGDDIAPVYQWLTRQSENGVLDAEVSWNFNKFLIDEKGHLIRHFNSGVTPLSDEIIKFLK